MDTANQFLPAEETLIRALMRSKPRSSLERVGIHVSRYGLVITLLSIGVLKFTAGEAQGIQPLVANSPLMFWLYRIFSLQRFQSNRSYRNRRCCAYRRAAVLRKALFHRQHWRHHYVRADGEFSLLDTGSVPVLTWISLFRGRRPVLNQGSCPARRIDLDCCRSTQGRLVHPSF
jgi:Protein of unknown function, DUF417